MLIQVAYMFRILEMKKKSLNLGFWQEFRSGVVKLALRDPPRRSMSHSRGSMTDRASKGCRWENESSLNLVDNVN